jgi:hypothetical protein
MENNQQPNTIGGFAPGNYWHKECKTCKKEFIGHKRAVQCEPCAINELNLESISSTDLSPELKQLVNDNWDYLIGVQDKIKDPKCECIRPNDGTCNYCESKETMKILDDAKEQAAEYYSEHWEEITGLDYEDAIPSEVNKIDFKNGIKWMEKRSYTEDEVRELIIKALTHNDDKLCGSLVTVEKEIRTANFNVWFEENKKK